MLELLVTLVILLLVLITVFQFTTNVEQAWKKESADPFADAEEALETIVSRAGSATLEPYPDYADVSGAFLTDSTASFTPDHLARRSDLAFACGPATGTTGWLAGSGRITAADALFFVAPQGYTQTEAHLGLNRLLDAAGFFVEFSDESDAPTFLPSSLHRWRWRLKEVAQPSEALGVYTFSASAPWVQTLVQPGASISVLAENVAALVLLPERSATDTGSALAPDYNYDSRNAGNPVTRNQLPARLRVVVVAIDETSAAILAGENGSQPPAVVPANLFLDSSKLDADLASLDAGLTAGGIRHRLLQREIILPAAAWSAALSP